jgi:hypothetical protein
MATKDSKGNYLRQGYRVEHIDSQKQGRIIGISQPYSICVEWDDGEEEVVLSRRVIHLSKVGR